MAHAFIPVPDCARVELIYQVNGITAENVFNVHKASPYSLADLQALRGLVNTWDGATWQGFRGTGCTLQRIRTKALDTASSPTEDFFLPTPRPGTLSFTLLPANVTYAIKLTTGSAGRSFRGRLYMVGLTTAQLATVSNQVLTSTSNGAVAALNTLLSNLAAGGHTLGVISYRTGGAYRSTGVFTAAIGWTAVDLNLDSMRRRLTGRGI